MLSAFATRTPTHTDFAGIVKSLKREEDKDSGELRQRHNEELLEVSSDRSDIVQTLELHRLRWAGHMIRMEEERSSFMTLMCQLSGMRSVGKPKLMVMANSPSEP